MTDVSFKLRSIADGDQGAAAWLYDAFAAPLYRRLRIRYGYPGGLEVDDLLHDTFVQALRGGAELLVRWLDRQSRQPTEAALERYLWDLACGLASNRRRSQNRSGVVSIDSVKAPAEGPAAERSVLGRDVLNQLESCIEATNERTYLYFKLRYVDGLKPDEIAQATGWSKKSTYKRKQFFAEALKRCARRLGLDL